MDPDAPKAPSILRWLAELIVSGPDAGFVCADLEDGWIRDRLRGASTLRAAGR